MRPISVGVVCLLALLVTGAPTGAAPSRPWASPFTPGVVLVGFRSGISAGQRRSVERAVGARDARRLGPPIRPVGYGRVTGADYLEPLELHVPDTQVLAVVRRLREDRAVAYAEPNYMQQATALTPNDPGFAPYQWGSNNTGQSVPIQNNEETLGTKDPGIPRDDDDALPAWQVTTGSRSIVVAEVDTGVQYTHPDLAANIWTNPGIGGCPAGTHGINVLANTCNPMDEDTAYKGHGTHVAGIIGAVGNNGIGVTGMNWQTTILPVKWMNTAFAGETSALIEGLQWLVAAKQAGVNLRVVNDSGDFTGTASSQALENEIETLGANNILFVSPAGNNGTNDDENEGSRYPCAYDRANQICVTSINHDFELPPWASYGPKTVNLAAPGVSVLSTQKENGYGYMSGASTAVPQVSGAAALILSVKPTMSATELKTDILNNVDKVPALAGRVSSGGTLDVCGAIPGCMPHPPAPPLFGKNTVGMSTDRGIFANFKVANAATLPVAGWVSRLRMYAVPGRNSGAETLKAVIYANSGGAPGALLATGPEVSYTAGSYLGGGSNGVGWLNLPFSSPVKLSPGTYWLGFIAGGATEAMGYTYESVASSRAYNANSFASGPSNPFGTATIDSEQASIYAIYSTTAPPPMNTAPPTISGSAQQGKTLTELHGTWTNEPTGYSYQWMQCDSSGSSCTSISGAAAQTYVPVTGDVGHTLKVQETASNAGGAGTPASSAATSVVVPPVPVNTGPPAISGAAGQGKTLTEVHGTWTNEPTSYTYRWLQCDSLGTGCLPITGASAQTYVPVAGDLGHTLEVQETASNAGGSGAPATSSVTAVVLSPVPLNTAPPTISGPAQQGQTLTESHGTWTSEPTGYTYQWLQCDGTAANCAPITGATAQTYVPVAADVGHTAKVQEVATNAGGAGAPAESAATLVVQPSPETGTTTSAAGGGTTGGSGPSGGGVSTGGAASRAQILSRLASHLVPSGKAAKIAALLRHGGYAFSFASPGAGTLLISWYLIPKGGYLAAGGTHQPLLLASCRAYFSKAGPANVMIKLTSRGARLLKHTQQIKLIVRASFTPKGKTAVVTLKTFALKR
jgi:Subtilase family/Fervidolysin N-terminal prodomain